MRNELAVVLMSGGIDSAVCMATACASHDRVVPVFAAYGQQTRDIELRMAKGQRHRLEKKYSATVAPLQVINYSSVFAHFADGVASPSKGFSEQVEEDGRSSGYVPMRNLHLIATAAGIADHRDAIAVYIGAQAGDESDYPDCRPEFIDAVQTAVNRSMPKGKDVSIRAPLIDRSKEEVIELAKGFEVDFSLTYSCYRESDTENPVPCGECPACLERVAAFRAAGVDDPYDTELNMEDVEEL